MSRRTDLSESAGRRRREGESRGRGHDRDGRKYVDLKDSYMSLTEALRHAGIRTRTRVTSATSISESIQTERHGLPERGRRDTRAGRGSAMRGIEGKIAAV
jgi:CTP synthase